ncbi:MAG: hypothetical protein IPF94_12130 [Betaproteobacteria bacterium]|nr:hypothetical protein [Betaproteobacteria bacterium]
MKALSTEPPPVGVFVVDAGETWYRIDGVDQLPPFFMVLAGDSDLWAFVSSAGSLAAGRHDEDGAFLPYETVDKIHARWEHTGPRTWILIDGPVGRELWEPFAPRPGVVAPQRSVWKNLSGTRIRFREVHPSGRLAFQYEWFTAAALGLVRSARLEQVDPSARPRPVRVLDGVLNLLPPGIGVKVSQTMSSLTDAYKWNEAAAGGRLGLFTLYAQIWDRAEPKECFEALTAWHAGVPPGARTLLSAQQVAAFCRGDAVEAETLTRGRRGAFLVNFDTTLGPEACEWHIVIDGPRSQVQAFELAQRLAAGGGTVPEIVAARQRNDAGLDELLSRADGFQQSADLMAAAHHRANVLFNIMRGGVFVDGTRFDRDDLLAFVRQRHHALGAALADTAAGWPAQVERSFALQAARDGGGAQAERLVLEYLPLTFSRRHGDPSRPWNRFAIRVRDAQGRRVLDHQGNWRDIFQNWEALLASVPAYAGSMIATFLGAMSPDGYNPYRIGRNGIDWEVIEHGNPWSHIGYWGDHQVIYLLKLMEAAQAHDPALLPSLWDRALFSFADIPYRLKPHAAQVVAPKHTIHFDEPAHQRATARATPGQRRAARLRRRRPAGAGHAGREAGDHPAGQGRLAVARRRAVAAHAASGVERRQQRAGGQRAVGRHAGASAALPLFPARTARGRAQLHADSAHAAGPAAVRRAGACDAAFGGARRHRAPHLSRRCRRHPRPLARSRLHRCRRPHAGARACRSADRIGARPAAAGRRYAARRAPRRRALRQLQAGAVHARRCRSRPALSDAGRAGGAAVLRTALPGRCGGAAGDALRQCAVHARAPFLPALP